MVATASEIEIYHRPLKLTRRSPHNLTRAIGPLYFTPKRVEERAPLKRWQLAAYVLLWILFAQVGLAARQTSITLDEPLHITSGYASLVTGDYRLVEEHPPCSR